MRIVVAIFRRRLSSPSRHLSTSRPRVRATKHTRDVSHARTLTLDPRALVRSVARRAATTRDETGGSPNAGKINSQNRPVTTREVDIENTTGFRIRVLKQGDDGRIWFKTRVTTRASERVEDDDVRTGTVRAV